MKNSILALTLFLVGCQPYLTYDEMSELAPTDPKMQKRLERFEDDVEKAKNLHAFIQGCLNGGCTLLCVDPPTHPRYKYDLTEFDDLDHFVRWYRRVRGSCGPVYMRRL